MPRLRAGGMACPRSNDKSGAEGPRRRDRSIQGGAGIHTGKKAFALRRYIVFNAEESEGMSARSLGRKCLRSHRSGGHRPEA